MAPQVYRQLLYNKGERLLSGDKMRVLVIADNLARRHTHTHTHQYICIYTFAHFILDRSIESISVIDSKKKRLLKKRKDVRVVFTNNTLFYL